MVTKLSIPFRVSDIREWVAARLPVGCTEAEETAIVRAICVDPASPEWGEPWDNYLAALPANLFTLISPTLLRS